MAFICGLCNATASNAFDFRDHFSTHTGEFAYKCVYCPFSAAYSSAVENHTICNHPGMDVKVTPVGHSMLFPDDENLKGYACGTCGLIQISKKNVERHVASVETPCSGSTIIELELCKSEPLCEVPQEHKQLFSKKSNVCCLQNATETLVRAMENSSADKTTNSSSELECDEDSLVRGSVQSGTSLATKLADVKSKNNEVISHVNEAVSVGKSRKRSGECLETPSFENDDNFKDETERSISSFSKFRKRGEAKFLMVELERCDSYYNHTRFTHSLVSSISKPVGHKENNEHAKSKLPDSIESCRRYLPQITKSHEINVTENTERPRKNLHGDAERPRRNHGNTERPRRNHGNTERPKRNLRENIERPGKNLSVVVKNPRIDMPGDTEGPKRYLHGITKTIRRNPPSNAEKTDMPGDESSREKFHRRAKNTMINVLGDVKKSILNLAGDTESFHKNLPANAESPKSYLHEDAQNPIESPKGNLAASIAGLVRNLPGCTMDLEEHNGLTRPQQTKTQSSEHPPNRQSKQNVTYITIKENLTTSIAMPGYTMDSKDVTRPTRPHQTETQSQHPPSDHSKENTLQKIQSYITKGNLTVSIARPERNLRGCIMDSKDVSRPHQTEKQSPQHPPTDHSKENTSYITKGNLTSIARPERNLHVYTMESEDVSRSTRPHQTETQSQHPPSDHSKENTTLQKIQSYITKGNLTVSIARPERNLRGCIMDSKDVSRPTRPHQTETQSPQHPPTDHSKENTSYITKGNLTANIARLERNLLGCAMDSEDVSRPTRPHQTETQSQHPPSDESKENTSYITIGNLTVSIARPERNSRGCTMDSKDVRSTRQHQTETQSPQHPPHDHSKENTSYITKGNLAASIARSERNLHVCTTDLEDVSRSTRPHQTKTQSQHPPSDHSKQNTSYITKGNLTVSIARPERNLHGCIMDSKDVSRPHQTETQSQRPPSDHSKENTSCITKGNLTVNIAKPERNLRGCIMNSEDVSRPTRSHQTEKPSQYPPSDHSKENTSYITKGNLAASIARPERNSRGCIVDSDVSRPTRSHQTEKQSQQPPSDHSKENTSYITKGNLTNIERLGRNLPGCTMDSVDVSRPTRPHQTETQSSEHPTSDHSKGNVRFTTKNYSTTANQVSKTFQSNNISEDNETAIEEPVAIQAELSYSCGSCDFHTRDDETFVSHHRIEHKSELAVWCRNCKKCFNNVTFLVKHIEQGSCETQEVVYHCAAKNCEFQTKAGQSFLYHLKHYHKESPFIFCNNCKKIFSVPACLVLHVQNECHKKMGSGKHPEPDYSEVKKEFVAVKKDTYLMPDKHITDKVERKKRGRGIESGSLKYVYSDCSDSDDIDDPEKLPSRTKIISRSDVAKVASLALLVLPKQRLVNGERGCKRLEKETVSYDEAVDDQSLKYLVKRQIPVTSKPSDDTENAKKVSDDHASRFSRRGRGRREEIRTQNCDELDRCDQHDNSSKSKNQATLLPLQERAKYRLRSRKNSKSKIC